MSTSVKIEEGHLTSPTPHNFQSRESHFQVFRNDYPISKLPGPNKLIRALIRGYHHYLCNEVTQDVIRTSGPLVILKLDPRHPCRDGVVENPGSDGLVKDLKQTGYMDITLADVRLVLEYYASKSKTFESDFPNRFIIRDPSKGWVEGVKISCEGDMTSLACQKYRDVWARPSTPEEDDLALINAKMGNPRPELPKVCSISQHMGFTLVVQDTEMELSVKPGPIAFANVEVQAMMTNADPASDGASWGSNDTEMLQLGLAPTVLVMRQDGKAISAKQVEIFVSYCKDVLRPKMRKHPKEKDNNNKDTSATYTAADQSVIATGEESWRKKFIKDYMKSSKFEAFIKVFKAEKLAAGDTTWVDVVSPRAV
ncbi:uncharacterized protein L3040_008303 [Drepanopeziza brunnea f. sp. 'multigermtubi']|nr:hypothetical protein L3040_008303 [Drepanopeziza brunnea f. sp. 'multigermtubi']